ncbi:NYN domain-containing protein [Amaricoccus sp.]|uniref:NYN domain-containing protein n=1 Tax=Amaricoccus sp. TaxID=1872485 RepID=UPI001B50120C|nr:NYN domain-containing protein [Amaricoccus sp.]MBP7242881.1 NYN domain-containing protein [Amaricoccus sp.]
MTNGRSPRLAVLIDADNTSARVAEGLFLEIAKLGEASVRRIYGDFADARMRGWAEALPRHAIVPQQNFAYTTGKNSADIALVIDAMDLLHSGRFDGFCLVSSDSDFTRLAARVREQGLDAFGFGQRKTPEAFRQACKRFFFTENLMPAPPEGDPAAARKESPAAALALLTTAVEEIEEDDGWVALAALGNQLQKIAPDFDSRTYGSPKLSTLIEKTGRFELDRAAKTIRLRLRPA